MKFLLYFCSSGKWSKAEVKDALEALEEKGLTRAMSEGLYIRQHSVDTQVIIYFSLVITV